MNFLESKIKIHSSSLLDFFSELQLLFFFNYFWDESFFS